GPAPAGLPAAAGSARSGSRTAANRSRRRGPAGYSGGDAASGGLGVARRVSIHYNIRPPMSPQDDPHMLHPVRLRTPRVPASAPLAAAIALACATLAPPALAHDDPTDLPALQVTASPLAGDAETLARPVEVLQGQALDDARGATLGETVARLPGVQTSYFGPGVGRPILRGLDGPRVQVLSSGLGNQDASAVSADHAAGIEPFLADQIEVLKGPATLLFGSGAIGGAVNVVDGRITRQVPDAPLSGRA